MATIYELKPDGAPVSGADTSAVRDASDGAIFWSCQMGGTPPQQAVFRFDGVRSERLKVAIPQGLATPVTGRGQLCVLNAQLWLNAWHEVGGKRNFLIEIPECRQPEPLALDPRVPGMMGEVEELRRQIEQGASLLSDEDRQLLLWVKGLRAVLNALG